MTPPRIPSFWLDDRHGLVTGARPAYAWVRALWFRPCGSGLGSAAAVTGRGLINMLVNSAAGAPVRDTRPEYDEATLIMDGGWTAE